MTEEISVRGGAAVMLCDAPSDLGGRWGEYGTIVFTPDTQVMILIDYLEGGDTLDNSWNSTRV